jgi:hypothetical protein
VLVVAALREARENERESERESERERARESEREREREMREGDCGVMLVDARLRFWKLL